MKLQFSLTTLLVCVTVLAAVCAIASRLKAYERVEIEASGSYYPAAWVIYRLPTASEVTARIVLWGPLSIVVTLIVLWSIFRLKSRRENGPPVA